MKKGWGKDRDTKNNHTPKWPRTSVVICLRTNQWKRGSHSSPSKKREKRRQKASSFSFVGSSTEAHDQIRTCSTYVGANSVFPRILVAVIPRGQQQSCRHASSYPALSQVDRFYSSNIHFYFIRQFQIVLRSKPSGFSRVLTKLTYLRYDPAFLAILTPQLQTSIPYQCH